MNDRDQMLATITELHDALRAQHETIKSLQAVASGSLTSTMASHFAITALAAELRDAHGLDCEAVARRMRQLSSSFADAAEHVDDAVHALATKIEALQPPSPSDPLTPRTKPKLVK